MSPRHNRPRGGEKPSERDSAGTDRFGLEQTVTWQDEEWRVRHVAGASATGKRYRCPGCDQEIPPATPHIVAWPDYGGVDDRRHWHKACWNSRDRRSSRIQRSRNAPRY
ncbi:ATP/GTP-binding protein [Streptomyces sp. NPDC006879]|uniref:ATP/GTP-binding protein n=1 Tax=Streptomyces sp. NPDC006879 TaxID=3364767 RepID=UPI003694CC59